MQNKNLIIRFSTRSKKKTKYDFFDFTIYKNNCAFGSFCMIKKVTTLKISLFCRLIENHFVKSEHQNAGKNKKLFELQMYEKYRHRVSC